VRRTESPGDRRDAAAIDRRASARTKDTPASRSSDRERLVHGLQSAVGNRATSRLLQAWRAGSGGASHRSITSVHTAVIQAKGRLALEQEPPALTTEAEIGVMNADSEEDVYLARGVTPTQKKYLDTEIIRGSFISFQKMLVKADEQQQSGITRPEKAHADDYVAQRPTAEAAKLVEFSTKTNIADTFAGEARYGYVFTIRIKRKYLTRGSSGSESGWIADQNAPFDIIKIERGDRLATDASKKRVTLTEDEFRGAVEKEEIAEYLLNLQGEGAVAAYFQKFAGAAKLAEVAKYQRYKSLVKEEASAEQSELQSRRQAVVLQ
jgi:hypothetical protein